MTYPELAQTPSNTRWTGVHLGPQWGSFDKLRLDQERTEKLEQLGSGQVGELRLKNGTEIMLVEKRDFQVLVAAAREIDRLRGGMRIMMGAAQLVQKHPGSDTVTHLIQTVMALGETPALPIREGHATLNLPEIELEANDQPLDPAEARRLAQWTQE